MTSKSSYFNIITGVFIVTCFRQKWKIKYLFFSSYVQCKTIFKFQCFLGYNITIYQFSFDQTLTIKHNKNEIPPSAPFCVFCMKVHYKDVEMGVWEKQVKHLFYVIFATFKYSQCLRDGKIAGIVGLWQTNHSQNWYPVYNQARPTSKIYVVVKVHIKTTTKHALFHKFMPQKWESDAYCCQPVSPFVLLFPFLKDVSNWYN